MVMIGMIKKLGEMLLRAEYAILIVCEMGIAALMCVAILLRYVLSVDFAGLQESVLILAMWLYFIGNAVATHDDSHISADVISDLIQSRKKYLIVSIIRRMISLVVYAYIAKLALEAAFWVFQTNPKTPVYRLPVVISWIPVAACFVLSVFYTLHHFIKDVRKLRALGGESRLEEVGG